MTDVDGNSVSVVLKVCRSRPQASQHGMGELDLL